MGLVVYVTPRPLYPQESDLLLRAGKDWCRKSRSHLDSIPDGPARGQSPNRLHNPGPLLMWYLDIVSGVNRRGVRLTTHLLLALGMRMTGSIPTFTLCADMACAGTNLPLPFMNE